MNSHILKWNDMNFHMLKWKDINYHILKWKNNQDMRYELPRFEYVGHYHHHSDQKVKNSHIWRIKNIHSHTCYTVRQTHEPQTCTHTTTTATSVTGSVFMQRFMYFWGASNCKYCVPGVDRYLGDFEKFRASPSVNIACLEQTDILEFLRNCTVEPPSNAPYSVHRLAG